jgi:hypothetical protein
LTALANIFFIDQPGRTSLLGYSKLSRQAKKPLLFTEIGWPQTTRTINEDSCDGRKSITDANTTVTQQVGDLWRLLGGKLHVPPAQKEFPLCPGTIYFEFSDEWYKQGELTSLQCLEKSKQLCTWIGTGATNTNFPGGWWDEAGFGVYSTKRAQGEADCAKTFDYLPEFNYFGPFQAYDRLELGKSLPNTRRYLRHAISDVYRRVPVAPSGASIPGSF